MKSCRSVLVISAVLYTLAQDNSSAQETGDQSGAVLQDKGKYYPRPPEPKPTTNEQLKTIGPSTPGTRKRELPTEPMPTYKGKDSQISTIKPKDNGTIRIIEPPQVPPQDALWDDAGRYRGRRGTQLADENVFWREYFSRSLDQLKDYVEDSARNAAVGTLCMQDIALCGTAVIRLWNAELEKAKASGDPVRSERIEQALEIARDLLKGGKPTPGVGPADLVKAAENAYESYVAAKEAKGEALARDGKDQQAEMESCMRKRKAQFASCPNSAKCVRHADGFMPMALIWADGDVDQCMRWQCPDVGPLQSCAQ
jgi:hypothetical protein